jgi:hypothetical protein
MLTVAIHKDGGMSIDATAGELRDLADWLDLAAHMGFATATFVTDEALTTIEIAATDALERR